MEIRALQVRADVKFVNLAQNDKKRGVERRVMPAMRARRFIGTLSTELAFAKK